ncbi:serine/threonine-protein phosphatase 4 regulatory subunit 1-like isoform X3 [Amblyomma americanum]
MPDDGDVLVPDQRTSGEADSVNPGNEASSCWSNFSLAMLTADQEETSAEQIGEGCEDDDAASRRQELLEEPNPVVKLERYAYSDIVFNRQLVARNIVDTLRAVVDSQEAVDAVLTALSSLSLDCEPSVRTELVEQLPNIASFCASEGGLLQNVVREHVVPILVQYLTDVANQVRKRTQVSLLFILERALIDRKQLEEQICSLVVHLTESENVDEYRMEAVTLMTKMAPYVGKDTTAYLFLPRFISLCQDDSFHVRKVCAANFGDFSSIVGQKYTEDNIPVFQMLCEDCVWGVRKACAEVFMPVSCICSLATRRNRLTPLFGSLLDDQSRWVRSAAYQGLGPFISTFADPLRTGLYCSEDGVVSMRVSDGPPEACSDEEAASPAETAVSLKGTGIQECAVTLVPPAADPVNFGKVGMIEDATSALLEKGQQQIAFDDDKGEPCGASSCMASVEDSCGHKNCAAMSLPKKLEDASTGCTAETVFDGALAAPKQFEGSLIQKDVPGDQQGCTETLKALSVEGDRQRLVVHVDSGSDSDFNAFQFWRMPIPELEVDIEFLGNRPTAVHVRAKSQSQGNRCFSSDLSVEVLGDNGKPINTSGDLDLNQDGAISSQRLSGDSTLRIRTASLSSLTSADQECNILLSSSVTEASVAFNEAGEVAGVHKVRMSNSKEVAGTENTLLAKSLNTSSDSWSAHEQDIVPVLLLERYQSMTDPTLAQNLDSDIGRHCAHSLPAVALTLGRQFWPCLRTTYRCLVSDVQWKVRHIVASCLHELATILGPEIASQDLVPSFEGFVKDVDEVRVGLLERLALFLRGLSKADQRRLLPLLADFLCMDNQRSWRFRFTLARQLKEIAALYSPLDVHQYLVPMVSELLVDKVAEVRHISVEAMVAVLQQLAPHYLMCKELLQQLCEKAQDRKWCQRQLFCELAEQMISAECLSGEEFIGTVLPKLLCLRHDSVPNVRMALARCLVRGVWPKAFFWDSGNIYKDELKATLASLQEDTDRDVRFYAQLYPKDSVD